MVRSICIITGCKLVLSNEGAVCHGDLFVLGDRNPDTQILTFNAVPANTLERKIVAMRWPCHPSAYFGEPMKIVMVDTNECFEKNGIFVFHRTSCEFNATAAEYVRGVL